MTLFEIEKMFPNGFHDASVFYMEMDYEKRIATMTISPMSSANTLDSVNIEKKFSLVFTGVHYFYTDAPDPRYPFSKPKSLWVDLSDQDSNNPLCKTLPQEHFSARFFVNEWNSFIHLAATNVELKQFDKS